MAEKVTIDLEVKDNSQSLKAQLREAQKEVQNLAAKYGATSQQVADAAKKVAELKDTIEDANDAIKSFKGEGTMLATSKALSSVASGFAAVQGAMGLLGAEGKDVEKALLKVQSAMAIADGLAGLEDFGRSFKQLKTVAVNAFQSIKTAIGSTGIGLLVVAIGTLYAYWDDIKAAVSGVSEEQSKLNVLSQENLDKEQKKLDAIGSQDNILKLQGKSEKEILAIKVKQIDATIKAGEVNLQNQIETNKQALEGEKRNYRLLKSYLDFVSMPLNFLYSNAAKGINGLISLINKIPGVKIDAKLDEKLVEKGAEWVTRQIFDPKELKKEGDAMIQEQQAALTKLKNDRAGYLLEIKNINKQTNANNAKTQKELDDAELERRKKINEKYEDLDEVSAKSLSDLIDEKNENLKKKTDDLVNYNIEKNKQDLENYKETQKNKELAEQRLRDARYNLTQSSLSAVSALVQAFAGKSEKQQKRAFEIQKAISIAQAVIDTYRAANAALASGSAINPAFGIISAATAIATGLANVAVIAKQKWQSPSALSGGNGGRETSPNLSQGSQSPNLNVIQYGQQSQLAQLQQQPIQAYVVSGEITSQQALDRNRLRNATL